MPGVSHTRTLAFIGMASLMPFHGAHAQAPAAEPEQPPMTSAAPKQPPTRKDLAGRFSIVQVLRPGTDHTERLRAFIEGTRSLAGVQKVFVIGEDAEVLTPLRERFKDRTVVITHDPGHRLAEEFALTGSDGAEMIVLDEAGDELFRHRHDGADAAKAVDEIRTRLTSAWTAPARGEYNLPRGSTLALQGYDVVSYFTAAKPVRGNQSITAEYRGVMYRFASIANRDEFVADPRKYLPTYGGWCASAMGNDGSKVSIDPTNFKVKDGRLFLFYKSIFADALKDWNRNEKQWEPAADANWQRLTRENPVP